VISNPPALSASVLKELQLHLIQLICRPSSSKIAHNWLQKQIALYLMF
jgi:hypothetical protein